MLMKDSINYLKFKILSLIINDYDNTIELYRTILHVKVNNKLFSIYALNICIPLIRNEDKKDKIIKTLVQMKYSILFYKVIIKINQIEY